MYNSLSTSSFPNQGVDVVAQEATDASSGVMYIDASDTTQSIRGVTCHDALLRDDVPLFSRSPQPNAVVADNPFNNSTFAAQTSIPVNIQWASHNENIQNYSQNMGQTYNVQPPDVFLRQGYMTNNRGMANGRWYDINGDAINWPIGSYRQIVQPAPVQGNFNGGITTSFIPGHNSPNKSRTLQTPPNPPVTHDISSTTVFNQPQQVSSSLQTGSKRPRDPEPPTTPPPPKRRRYQMQPSVAYIPTFLQPTLPTHDAVTGRMNPFPLQSRMLCPPHVKLGPGRFMCQYSGPADVPTHGICNAIIKSSSRNNYRHLSIHAKKEEAMIEKGLINLHDAHALLWVKKLVFKCDRCEYRVSTWRLDGARRQHEREMHPDIAAARVEEEEGDAEEA